MHCNRRPGIVDRWRFMDQRFKLFFRQKINPNCEQADKVFNEGITFAVGVCLAILCNFILGSKRSSQISIWLNTLMTITLPVAVIMNLSNIYNHIDSADKALNNHPDRLGCNATESFCQKRKSGRIRLTK
jgi:hypothetical protein